jgi:integrase
LYKNLYRLLYGDTYITLAELFPRFMLYRRDMNKVSDKTMRENLGDWNRYLKDSDLVNIPLRDLKPRHFIAFFEVITKDRTMTSKSVGNIKSLLNKMYAYAIREELTEQNPVKTIDFSEFKYYIPDNSEKVYTLENRYKLLCYLHDMTEPYALAIQLDFQLTCRIGELKALRWESIDFGNHTITINKQALVQHTMNDDLTFNPATVKVVPQIKGNTPSGKRKLPMTREAERILRLAKEINPDGEYVFMPNGKLMLTDTFNEYLRKYCNEADVPYLSSHKIRFTSCSTLYNGENLAEISKLMGHSQVATTLHYLRNVNDHSNMLEQMENAFAVSAPNLHQKCGQ